MSSGRKSALQHAPAAPRLSPPPAPVGNHASAPARAALRAPRREGEVSDVTASSATAGDADGGTRGTGGAGGGAPAAGHLSRASECRVGVRRALVLSRCEEGNPRVRPEPPAGGRLPECVRASERNREVLGVGVSEAQLGAVISAHAHGYPLVPRTLYPLFHAGRSRVEERSPGPRRVTWSPSGRRW